jgi:hypothetical protein
VTSTFDHYKTWIAGMGACFVGTWLCYISRISGTEWVAMLVSVFVPLIVKEGAVQIKNIGAGNSL